MFEIAVREIRENDVVANKMIPKAIDWVHLHFHVSEEEAVCMASVVSNSLLE